MQEYLQFVQSAPSVADRIFLCGRKLGECLIQRRIIKYGIVPESLSTLFFCQDNPVDFPLDFCDDLPASGQDHA